MLTAGTSHASAATLSLKSGNGVVNGPDSAVRIIAKSAPAGIVPRPATIVAKNPAWAAPLGTSQWVSTAVNGAQTGTAGSTTYELKFTVPSSVGAITLAGNFYADNIGTSYLNGVPMSGQAGCVAANFQAPPKPFASASVLPGPNTLVFIVYNCGGPSGLDFDATVTYTAAPPAPAGLDHFKCYTVKRQAIRSRAVTLRDQFATKKSSVREARQLCNPVAKTIGKKTTGVRNRSAHLVCRRTVDAKGAIASRVVRLRNQFGVMDAVTTGSQTLCIPSLKRIARRATTRAPTGRNPERVLDHFRCYGLKPQQKSVGINLLRDQFGKGPAKVVQLVRLCNPVRKTYRRKVSKIKRPAAHLACYTISDGAAFKPLNVAIRNQFGKGRLRVLKAETLCLPTYKQVLIPHADPVPGPATPAVSYVVGLTATACASASAIVHTVKGTTTPIRPIGTATVTLSQPGAYPGAYPAVGGTQTVPLAADGTFTAKITTASSPGGYRWIATVKDIDETSASSQVDIAVPAKPPAC